MAKLRSLGVNPDVRISCTRVTTFLLLVATPCAFLYGALVLIRPLAPTLQYYSYLGLVMLLTVVQIAWAAGPIANGLVQAVITLPRVVTRAFVNLNRDVADKLEVMVQGIVGDTASAYTVHPIVSVLTQVIGPVLMLCAGLLNPQEFLPAAFTDVSRLWPLLVIAIFAVFVYLWSFLSTLIILQMGIVTGAVAFVMFLLLQASLCSHQVVAAFVKLVQILTNFMLRKLIIGMLPSEALDHVLQQLGPKAPKLTDLKMLIAKTCQLNINLDDDDDEEDLTDNCARCQNLSCRRPGSCF